MDAIEGDFVRIDMYADGYSYGWAVMKHGSTEYYIEVEHLLEKLCPVCYNKISSMTFGKKKFLEPMYWFEEQGVDSKGQNTLIKFPRTRRKYEGHVVKALSGCMGRMKTIIKKYSCGCVDIT